MNEVLSSVPSLTKGRSLCWDVVRKEGGSTVVSLEVGRIQIGVGSGEEMRIWPYISWKPVNEFGGGGQELVV